MYVVTAGIAGINQMSPTRTMRRLRRYDYVGIDAAYARRPMATA